MPGKRRRTARRWYECLQVEGYLGGYRAVQRFVKDWTQAQASRPTLKQAFVPLAFPPGETCQFDWRHETAVIGGVEQTIKVGHFRPGYSRQMLVIAYLREIQERVLDAIFVGKERRFNRRFLALAKH